MGRKPLLVPHQPFIDFVIDDLKLHDIDITFHWRYNWAHQGDCSWPETYAGKEYYRIGLARHLLDYPVKLYGVIAHELRHCWQMHNGHLKANGGRVFWKEASKPHSYVPKSSIFIPWNKRPEEIDANAYQDRVYRNWRNCNVAK